MSKSIKSKNQMTMFGTHEFPSYERTEDVYAEGFGRNVINLRKELKDEIPNTTYLTHGIHNFYPAKFIPQVPRFVIKKFDLKNKIILDPFAGSGTTAVESLITGDVSNDINAVSLRLIPGEPCRNSVSA